MKPVITLLTSGLILGVILAALALRPLTSLVDTNENEVNFDSALFYPEYIQSVVYEQKDTTISYYLIYDDPDANLFEIKVEMNKDIYNIIRIIYLNRDFQKCPFILVNRKNKIELIYGKL